MANQPAADELKRRIETLRRKNRAIVKAYRKTKASEILHRLTLENISDTVLITKDDGRIIYVCPNTSAIFGLTQKEIQRMGNVQRLLNGTVCDTSTLRDGEEIRNIEWAVRNRSGQQRLLLITVKSVSIAGGTRLYVMHDITDRKRTLEDLDRHRMLLSEAERLANVGGWEWDIVTDVWTFSENWMRIHGCSSPRLSTAELLPIAHPADIPRVEAAFSKAMETGAPYEIEHRIIKQDTGEIRHIHAYGDIRQDAAGKSVKMFGAAQDITERKWTEEKNKTLQRQLNQAQKMEAIGTLAGGIAHDFNNLLMGIQGQASMLAVELGASHPQLEHVTAIESHVKSASGLTRQLLGIARSGKFEVKPFDLGEMVKTNADMFGRTRKELQITNRNPPRPVVVEGDQQQIGQVLLNIFVNAWQAMPEGGELRLKTDTVLLGGAFCAPHQLPAGPYARVLITDTGTGMDEHVRQRIFDPFFTTKEKGSGTGLGLSSSYGIIKNHNGMITVDSELGRGTTFTIHLPLSQKPVDEDVAAAPDLITGKETVLLVDDQEIVLKAGSAMLKKLGYRVLLANHGEKAVETVSEMGTDIDLVILDMIMPGMDGGKTFDSIRAVQPTMPVLLSSGYSIHGQAEAIMVKGCNGFLQKPFDIYTLSSHIRKVLDAVKTASPSSPSIRDD
jgi:PAS domain S-box-containing protein